jgi:hypothetical protein
MPALIVCPKCNRKLRVPENLMGKKVKCPSCGTAFTAAEAEEDLPTAPLIEEKEAPPSPRRKPAPSPPDEEFEEESPKVRRRPAPPPPEEEEEETETDDEEVRPRRRRPVEEEEEEDPEEDERRRRKRRLRSRARSAVAGPAIALLVVGGLSLALNVVELILIIAGVNVLGGEGGPLGAPQDAQAYKFGRVGGVIFGICWSGIILSAGFKMKNLQGYGYAKAGSILAMLPCYACCLLGLPFGIWSLVVLNKPEVKKAFR